MSSRAAAAAAVAVILALGPTSSGCAGLLKGRRDDQDRPGEQGSQQGEPSTGQTPPPAPPEDEPGVHRVDPRFAPLEAVVERMTLPGFSDSALTTIGTKVYVVDLERWLQRHPPGSATYDAVLLHEQVHAQRQLAAGVDPWIQRYVHDRAFMWDEEQRGWYVELRHLQARGLTVNREGVARSLSKYKNLAGAMVSYDDALAWTTAVLDGRWTPPP